MEILLKCGQVLLVDDLDWPWIAPFTITAKLDRKNGSWYAYALSKVGTQWHWIGLGRLLLGLRKGDKRECEHIDPNATLDYRRSNIRIATRAQNNANRRMRKDNTSGYKGVSRNPDRRGGWKAQIMVNKKAFVLGICPTPEEAYDLYCMAARQHHGEFARPERAT